jgi:hypothetical protein
VAILIVALAAAAGSGIAARAETPIVIDDPLSSQFHFDLTPSKLPRTKSAPVRLSIAGSNKMDDGSHVPALHELELKLDRHFSLDVKGVPVCGSGSHFDVRPNDIGSRCADAAVADGQVTLEVAFPEEPLTTVTGSLTVYNRGRKPGGADFVGWAYFPAPVTGEIYVPVKVRKADDRRYGWRVRLQIPKIAGGSGSIAAYSVRFRKRIVSATCGDGKLLVAATSTFADGAQRFVTEIRPCTVAEADARQ